MNWVFMPVQPQRLPNWQKTPADVFIVKDGEEVDATSILDVIGLYCPAGPDITVRIADEADMKVLDRIVGLIETGLREF